jgi:SAM-dependent methyltransferase
MAAGYATSRPPVHPRVMEEARRSLGWSRCVSRALDVGCGAGLSTSALAGMAKECMGIEPAEEMLKWSAMVAPEAHFAAGTAESMPICDHSMDLMTAAGSLNYVNLDLFFPEAARVLKPEGVLIVYDFEPGRSLRHTRDLDEWFQAFLQKYPQPLYEGRSLSPEILAQFDSGFRTRSAQRFEIEIELTPQFYIDYMLTETNAASAVRAGAPPEEVRAWCEEMLAPIWKGRAQAVLFRGYFACLSQSRYFCSANTLA